MMQNFLSTFCSTDTVFGCLGLKASLVNVTGLRFKITSVLEKHVVEEDTLFTNHLAGK